MSTQNINSKKIISVHYLRGFACLFVVLMHYGSYIHNKFFYGIFGVDLFFIISGFIITLTTTKSSPCLQFLKKRFIRIYPSFFIVWFIAVLTIYNNEPYSQIIKSLFLLHKDYNWHSAPGFGWNMIGPPWTLTYEFLFYGIFALAMAISQKYRVIIASFFIISAVLSLQYIYNGTINFDSYISAKLRVEDLRQIFIKLMSTTILFEFVAGMLIAYNYQRIKQMNIKHSLVTGMFCVIISLSLFIYNPDCGFGMHGFFWHTLFLFIGFILLEPVISRYQFGIFNFLGNISYTLYLVHFPVKLAYEKYIPVIKDSHHNFAMFSLILATSLMIATLLHKLVEAPLMNMRLTHEK